MLRRNFLASVFVPTLNPKIDRLDLQIDPEGRYYWRILRTKDDRTHWHWDFLNPKVVMFGDTEIRAGDYIFKSIDKLLLAVTDDIETNKRQFELYLINNKAKLKNLKGKLDVT